ncbi:DcaP family trimeric outer membrane transporter [Marinobacter sp. X15-166B]|uniref:DcaP family trimeric outer membrane transporter n=1 Tax=Marinobacter sp. X15-166B TaxID=1897620 RepID=UPI00085BB5E4|nr:DcaP family trimeric outer membrane transporter [Marinobacter sp. X15-166B]OEY65594.1 hypothetical protein BG841_03390 [Marinobacter sp. X15-166B]
MRANKLSLAIRATAAVAVFGVAGQVQAFSFSAGDVDADLYGYARLNMSYDMDSNVADATQSGGFPDASDNIDGHFGASANQSRLGVRAKHASGVTAQIEGDFYGGSLRIRHAYGSYKGVIAGQTWSNYSSFVGSTPTLDFSGLAGNAGFQSRTAQLRYTTGALSFSIEDPKTTSIKHPTTGDELKRDSSPALTARLEDKAGGLSYAVGAMVKQNTADDGNDDDSKTAFAVFGAAKVALSDMISIQGAINYTDGANGYLYRSGAKDDAEFVNGSLDNISGMGGLIGTSISLGNGRSVNIGYGTTIVEYEAGDLTNQNAFVNYMWTPVQNVMMGVEYGYYDTEDDRVSTSADANRIMFAAQYNF